MASAEKSSFSSESKEKESKNNKRGKDEQVDEAGPLKKKMKIEKSLKSNSPDEIPVKEETTIHDLPPEMLLNLLQHVNTRTLFACRRVNRQWSEISSELLRSRPGAEIQFVFSEKSGFLKFKSLKRSLQDFVQLFKESKNCPIAHVYFGIKNDPTLLKPSTFFKNKGWIEFLSDFPASKIKGLKLRINRFHDIKSAQMFTRKLGDCLVNKMEHLEEFGLNLPLVNDFSPAELKLKLFPKIQKNGENSAPIQLVKLKVIHVVNSSLSKHPAIFQQLLTAAVNLKKIEPFYSEKLDAENLKFLCSLSKIHCLKRAEIPWTPQFFSSIQQIGNSPSLPFKLKEVRWKMGAIFPNPDTWTNASLFISNLFESSKTTLTTLTLEPLGFLPSLKFPTFTNLNELTLIQDLSFDQMERNQMFPRGIRSTNIFPAVRFLYLEYFENWSAAFPQEDSIPRLPSVESLVVADWEIGATCISKMALLCPHLKRFQVVKNGYEPPQLSLLEVGRAVWTHMKQLETLELDLDLNSPENTPTALDSCFTGISLENCQRIYQVTQAVATLKKWGYQSFFREAEPEPETAREHSSILDMKDLRRLIVNPYFGEKLQERRKFFTENLTWISQDYAFKFMPQLEISE